MTVEIAANASVKALFVTILFRCSRKLLVRARDYLELLCAVTKLLLIVAPNWETNS